MLKHYKITTFLLLLIAIMCLLASVQHLSYFPKYKNVQSSLTNLHWKLNERSSVYEFDGKPPLWLYWDNKNNLSEMPPHICLGLKSLHCHNHNYFTIRILNSKLIHAYISDVHPIFPYLTPAHRADYARGRILEKYGGMYMDIDVIALRSLVQWFDLLSHDGYDIVGYSWLPSGDRIGIGTLGPVRANHSLFRNYTVAVHEKMNQRLNQTIQKKRDLFRWAELLRLVLVPVFHELLRRNETKSMMYNGPKTVGQIIKWASSLLSNSNCDLLRQLNLSTPYLLYHNSILKRFNGTDQQLLESKTLIGCLYRIALKDCKTYSNRSTVATIPSCQDLQFLYTKGTK